jgi:hypothetical protein
MRLLETFIATPVGVLTLIDLFAQLRGMRGLMPSPIPPVRFTLISRGQGAALNVLDPPIVLDPQTGDSGAYLFPDEAHLSGPAACRIAPGPYMLRIEADYYETEELELTWPPSPGNPPPVELKPGVAYPFPDLTLSSARLTLLRGTVLRTVSGAPVAQASVELIDPPGLGPFAQATTDEAGGWVLALLGVPAGAVNGTLRFTLPELGGVVSVPNVSIQSGQENSLSQTALRGVVLSTTGVPVVNADVTVSNQAGSVRSDRDGRWTFYLSLLQPDGAARVTATAPNGRSSFQDVQIRNRASVLVPAIQIAMN